MTPLQGLESVWGFVPRAALAGSLALGCHVSGLRPEDVTPTAPIIENDMMFLRLCVEKSLRTDRAILVLDPMPLAMARNSALNVEC